MKKPNKRSFFQWKPFSRKQMRIMTWWCPASPVSDMDGIIADGAVRSGKTVPMAISFVNWAMESFKDYEFAICGKTIGSLRRNVINTLKKQLPDAGYEYEERRTDNMLTIQKGARLNTFYLFGGNDERSQDLIQGMTLAGVLFDEVALMPASFVEQAEARCSVDGAKMWYNCNPKGPSHFFKKEYVDKAAEKRLYYLHFTMDDNLTLTEKVKERYKRQFAGVFFQRNVLGLWVTAEGKIYTAFSDDNIIPKSEWYAEKDGKYTHPLREQIVDVTMGVDFGGNRSAHAFNLTGFTRGYRQLITLKERHLTKALTPNQLESEFVQFVEECRSEYPALRVVYCDSAEQVLIRGFRNALAVSGIPVVVKNARKGEIIDRIHFYSSMQNQHRYFVISDCVATIDAFENAVWDDKKDNTRLDDGTINIDSLDAQEYSSEHYMKVMLNLSGKERLNRNG